MHDALLLTSEEEARVILKKMGMIHRCPSTPYLQLMVDGKVVATTFSESYYMLMHVLINNLLAKIWEIEHGSTQ